MKALFNEVGFILLLALYLVGCSKSSNNPVSSNNNSNSSNGAPTFMTPNFPGPNSKTSSADTSQGYYEVNTEAALLDSGKALFTPYFKVTPTLTNQTWTWNNTQTHNDTSLIAMVTAVKTSEGYNWDFTTTFKTPSSTQSFDLLSGFETTKGDSGDFSSSSIFGLKLNIYWSTNSTGDRYGNAVFGQGKYVFTYNTDKSGYLKEYTQLQNGTWAQTWNIIWNADQSGSYTEWTSDGKVIAVGKWS
jgi:hypothetical protein